jgi:hypothetical protein
MIFEDQVSDEEAMSILRCNWARMKPVESRSKDFMKEKLI